MVSEIPRDDNPPSEPHLPLPSESETPVDILERFVRQLTNLSRFSEKEELEGREELFQTVADVQSTADDILRHFAHLKAEISNEVDARLQGAVAETIDPAIYDTLEMKKALNVEKEHIPHSLLEGSWSEQIARWVSLYAKWKGKKEVARQVMKNLAQKVDLLIEKDLQFIEQYQQQSLSHLEEDPAFIEDLKNRIQYHLDEPIRKLKALKKNPEKISLEEASQWSEKIHRKRGSYLDTVLQKIESFVDEEAPFSSEPTDISMSIEIGSECDFLEKEVEHVLALKPRIDRNNPNEIAFIENRLSELRGYIEELLEAAGKVPSVEKRLRSLLKKI